MQFQSINPYTEELYFKVDQHTDKDIRSLVDKTEKARLEWNESSLDSRIYHLQKLSSVLENDKEILAPTITTEMGKPLVQAVKEIEKCAWLCDYYADNAKSFLEKQQIETDSTQSFVRFEPLGLILAIMPWNFPFWQFFRCAIPAMCAGNGLLLKHASNVPQCAISITETLSKSGFPDNLVSALFIDHDQTDKLISNVLIAGVALTGSEKAGSIIGSSAGKHIKKTVMELGGSDAFIVLADADLESAAETAVKSRMQNNGQSCIAAKRFIIHTDVYKTFLDLITENIRNLKIGDPCQKDTDIGPLARDDLAHQVEVQVNHSKLKGAIIHFQSESEHTKGFFIKPAILTNVHPGMPAFDDEVFGPVASIIQMNDNDEALELANKSKYGLGASLWTNDNEMIKKFYSGLQTGNVMVNEMVTSDPRMPFGGVKLSGYGRELGKSGLMEFVNIKSVRIN